MDPYVIYGHLESGDQISIPFSLILSKAVNLFYVFCHLSVFSAARDNYCFSRQRFYFSPTRVG